MLGYCGLKWFKLIVSRRYDGSAPWGFTLMRKRPGGGMPIAEYFVLPNGKIPSFSEDALYPFMKGDGKRYRGCPLGDRDGHQALRLSDRFSLFRRDSAARARPSTRTWSRPSCLSASWISGRRPIRSAAAIVLRASTRGRSMGWNSCC